MNEELRVKIDVLKAKLIKLKDKEARLEADLAIREHPDTEEAVYDIIVALAQVRKVDREIKVIKSRADVKSAEETGKKREFYNKKLLELGDSDTPSSQIKRKFFTTKLSQLKEVGAVKIPTFDGLKLKRKNALAELKEAFVIWNPKLLDRGFRLDHLLPSVADYINIISVD